MLLKPFTAEEIAAFDTDWHPPLDLPALCGGSPEADPVITYETALDGNAWVVKRDGKPVFRSKSSPRPDAR